ncbi:MAG: class I SAM-dependent RNA methyltransferase [Verrucomicrobiales bacterium]|nr:class I SAM-dependent RNA methyltransferase [Verrucomicrobiales bacterium]
MSDPQKKRPRKFNPEPFGYHEEIDLTIDSLTNLGQGVGRVKIRESEADWVVFVPFTVPGEKIRARIFRNSANFSEADLVEIIEPSPERVEPQCPLFGDCGGCQYQHLDYATQLRWKQKHVAEVLRKLANVETEIDPVIPSPVEYGYRSKITPHFQRPRDGVIDAIGFLRFGRRQMLIDVPQCPIASGPINEKIGPLRAETHRNALSYKKGATLLLRDSAEAPGLVCTDSTDVCEEVVGDLRFQFHAGEFFQNNPHILPAFTGHVAEEASAGGAKNLVDAYCGSGLFCLTAANRFERAAGIEISEPAIDWAQRNAKLNDIENVRFIQGDAADIFASVPDFNPAETAVIIDPPRKGSSTEFLAQLVEFRPARIVYVSCNPSTQARDLNELKDHFRITRVQPFDLFPQTRHLECVITLETIQQG